MSSWVWVLLVMRACIDRNWNLTQIKVTVQNSIFNLTAHHIPLGTTSLSERIRECPVVKVFILSNMKVSGFKYRIQD